MGVAENIKRLRDERGLTQAQLATRAGVGRSSIAQWEKGWAVPNFGNTMRIACALDVDPGMIIEEQPLPEIDKKIAIHIDRLNEEGRKKALAYIKDLAEVPKYQK